MKLFGFLQIYLKDRVLKKCCFFFFAEFTSQHLCPLVGSEKGDNCKWALRLNSKCESCASLYRAYNVNGVNDLLLYILYSIYCIIHVTCTLWPAGHNRPLFILPTAAVGQSVLHIPDKWGTSQKRAVSILISVTSFLATKHFLIYFDCEVDLWVA